MNKRLFTKYVHNETNLYHIHHNLFITWFVIKMDPQNVQIILKNDHKWSCFNIIYPFLFGYNMVV